MLLKLCCLSLLFSELIAVPLFKSQLLSNFISAKSNTEDDDFFKDSSEVDVITQSPGFFQQTFNRIAAKFQLGGDEPKQQVENIGYFYDKPSAKQESFEPSSIGVFFAELFASLVGLIYGGYAQATHTGTTTPASVN